MFTTLAAWSGCARLWSQYLEGVQSQAGIHKETSSKPNQPPTHPIQKPRISCWHPCSEFFTHKLYVALILAFRPSHHFIKVGLGKSSFRTHPPIPTRSQPWQPQATTSPGLRGCKKPGFSATSAKVTFPNLYPRPQHAPQRESELERTPRAGAQAAQARLGEAAGAGLRGGGEEKGWRGVGRASVPAGELGV